MDRSGHSFVKNPLDGLLKSLSKKTVTEEAATGYGFSKCFTHWLSTGARCPACLETMKQGWCSKRHDTTCAMPESGCGNDPGDRCRSAGNLVLGTCTNLLCFVPNVPWSE